MRNGKVKLALQGASSDGEELAKAKLMETRLSSGSGTGTKTNDPDARAVDKVRLAGGN